MKSAANCVLLCFVASLASCQSGPRNVVETDPNEAPPLFAPTTLRIHPFTSVKDWTGRGKPDGVEALIELQDRFRDPTKATGTVLFELFDYKRNHADPRGDRLKAWRGSLMTLEEQRTHWNRISRTYSFQLSDPQIRLDRSYVLQVWFDTGGKRLTSQVILEMQEPKPEDTNPIPVTQPASRPTTRPATGPATGPASGPASGPSAR